MTIYEDNQAAMAIAKSGVQKSRNNHMEIRFFWIHEHIAQKELLVEGIDTEDQLADIFTKPLSNHEQFENLRTLIGVRPIPSPSEEE